VTTRVAVLGSAGFIGRVITSALNGVGDGVAVQTMVRTLPKLRVDHAPIVRVGDVRDADSVRAAVRGARAVVHTASYVGYDPELCESTNVCGTKNVVAACRAEGVEQVVYMSTASVYGSGPHRGASEEQAVLPKSVLSRSRADAELMVLDAGGAVLRPDMVFGDGDRWFGSGLARFTAAIGGLVDGGAARMSMIHVDDLATIVARTVLSPQIMAGPFNVAYEKPNTVREMAALLNGLGMWNSNLPSLERSEALTTALARGFTERQFELLTTDHWFDATSLNLTIGADPASDLSLRPSDLDWYRSVLT
jgi:nucleoside-diphosphate-sugar epimerase